MTTLSDLAQVRRSKNAGPFWMTIDIFFENREAFDRAVASDLTKRDFLARVYFVDPDRIEVFTDQELLVVKISMPRRHVQGSFRDSDMHAGQQFVPLLDIEVDSFETEPHKSKDSRQSSSTQ